ncbi:MAG: DUF262 domain-containing protein [Methanogenium sp.]|nr:DUF262 domain-containing protein [Methanogenium sp.]
MKAKETQLLRFLNISNQYIIPLYQRTYSWSEKQCAQLWDDIVRAGSDESIKGHFIGSVVYIEKGHYVTTEIQQMLVIDGQQRLTTISLLIAALGQAIKNMDDITTINQKKLNNYYLFNSEEEGDLRYKLLLTRNDRESLTRILDERKLPENFSERIVDNFEFFKEKIANSGTYPLIIYEGLKKLMIVDIALNRECDNPQLIFESLNSTGLQLSQADLIRNYVLMGLDTKEQESLYTEFWHPIEQQFHESDEEDIFDRFMRDYLIVRTRKMPRFNQIYEAFKTYMHRIGGPTIHEIVADIHKFSLYFTAMNLGHEEDDTLRKIFDNIKTLRMYVAYPFLIEVYDDYQNGIINRDEFIEILTLTENYVFRRTICGIPTNSLNKTFANLSRELDKENYLETFKGVISNKESYRRFPPDDEFKRELVVRDLYHSRNFKYLLRKLENFDTKELINVDNYTIEHIMPQNENLSAKWRQDLGENWKEVQDEYLHTLGNLTLTGYNQELSDRPFIEKRDMTGGLGSSHIRLNQGLSKVDRWNETEIKRRAKMLTNLAVKIWTYPTIVEEATCYYNGKDPYVTPVLRELYQGLIGYICNKKTDFESCVKKGGLCLFTFTEKHDILVRPETALLNLYVYIPFDKIRTLDGITVEDGSDYEKGYSKLIITSQTQFEKIEQIIENYRNPDDFLLTNAKQQRLL